MCLLGMVVCISLVLVFVIAFPISTIVRYEAERVLVHNDITMSFTFRTLCKEDYDEYCLKGGECYVVSMKVKKEAVACMSTSVYGRATCEITCGGRKMTRTIRQKLLKRQVTKCF